MLPTLKVQQLLKSIFQPAPALRIQTAKLLLGKKKATIVDVGATGGLDPRWENLRGLIQFITFDPDSRASFSEADSDIQNYQLAVGAAKEDRTLFLTRFPNASSFYAPNMDVLNLFENARDHEIVGTISLPVDKLDDLVANSKVDFIKTDAEGADLEILKGSCDILANSCLGIQAEVQFLERNIGSPKFCETNAYLETFGFDLYHLQRACFYKDKRRSVTTRGQMVFANAIYFKSEAAFLQLLSGQDPTQRRDTIGRLLLLLLVYRAHDTALLRIKQAHEKQFVNDDDALLLSNAVASCIGQGRWLVFGATARMAASLAVYLLLLPSKRYRPGALRNVKRQLAIFLDFLAGFTASEYQGREDAN